MNKIFFDNNATTQIAKEVIEVMLQEFQMPLNPSSTHFMGQRAKVFLSKARRDIANFLQIDADRLIFTSGGTEANNMMLSSLAYAKKKPKVLTTALEHASIWEMLKQLEKQDLIELQVATVPNSGLVNVELLKPYIDSVDACVLMAVNNETGVKLDLDAVAALCLSHEVSLYVDGVALLGKDGFIIPKGVSAMTFSAHKIHGPKGIGLLYIKEQLNFNKLIGGPQENNKRAGTENLAGILGFAEAVRLFYNNQDNIISHIVSLRDYFEKTLSNQLDNIIINGSTTSRICNTSNVLFLGIDGEALFMALDMHGIATSLGSACSSGSIEPSRILMNMGLSRENASSSLRFSFSRYNTFEEIDRACSCIVQEVSRLRSLAYH